MKSKWRYPEDINEMKFTDEMQEKVMHRIDYPPQKRSHSKILVRGFVAMVLFFILLGSSLLIPGMESVTAKIPLINQFLVDQEQQREETNSVYHKVREVVEANGLKIRGHQFQTEEKKMTLGIVDLTESQSEKMESQLGSLDLDGYTVSFVPFEENLNQQDTENIEEYARESQELEEILTAQLMEKGYELMYPIEVRINNTEGLFISIIVPESEDRVTELKDIVAQKAEDYNNDYKLDLRQVDKIAREQEKKWLDTGALTSISNALMDAEEFNVTGFSFKFYPYPLQMKVKTFMDASDPKSQQIAEDIRSEIDLFIQTSERTEAIQGDEYHVIILSKDNKEIK